MKKVLFSCAAALLLFGACKKKDDGGSPSRTAILTSGKWLVTAATSQQINNGVADPIEDEFVNYSACEKDDYTIFSTTGNSVIIDENVLKCQPNQQYTVGTWALQNNDSKLLYKTVLFDELNNIDQLDDNTLKTTSRDTSGTDVYISTITYKHIK